MNLKPWSIRDRYLISDCGRVFVKTKQSITELKQRKNNHGYQVVTLSQEQGRGCRRKYLVHQLVLHAHKRPKKNNEVCRHLDGNKENNRLSNLAWGTHKENSQDSIEHGTMYRGEDSPVSKLTNDQVIKIHKLAHEGKIGQREIGKMYDIHQVHVSQIKRELIWKHLW